jgi:O-antigen ligase
VTVLEQPIGDARSAARDVRSAPNPWRSLTFAALCVFWFTLPWDGVLRFGEGTTLARLIGIAATGVAAVALMTERPRSRPGDFVVLTLLFAAWVGISFLWTQSPELTYERVVTMTQLAVLVLLAWEFAQTRARLQALMAAWVAGSALLAGFVIVSFLAGQAATRYTAPGTHPGDVSFVLALSIPIAWYLSFTARRSLTTAALRLYVPFAVLGMTLTAARAGLFALAVVLTLIPLTISRMSARGKILLALAMGAIAVVLTALSGALARPLARLATTGTELQSGTLDQRTTLWEIGFRMVGEHPLVGVGAGSSRMIVGGQFYEVTGLHNAYLSVAAELGVVGLCLLLLILLAALWPAIRHTPPLEQRFATVLGLFLLMSQLTRHAEYDKSTWATLITLALVGSVMGRPSGPRTSTSLAPTPGAGVAVLPRRSPGGTA